MTAAAVVALARSYVGTVEHPAGSNCQPFSHRLGRPCHYWCADFVAAIFDEAGQPLPPGANTASTRLNLAAFKKAGRFVAPHAIEPGDVVFFHIGNRNGNDPNVPTHTGIAVKPPTPMTEFSVEGNTSSGDGGSQDNGGGVFGRSRSMSVVIGAGRPDYALIPQPEEEDMAHKIWRPVGAGSPNVGGEYLELGDTFIILSADEKQQLANSEAGGDPAKLHVQDAQPELWKRITQDYTKVVT